MHAFAWHHQKCLLAALLVKKWSPIETPALHGRFSKPARTSSERKGWTRQRARCACSSASCATDDAADAKKKADTEAEWLGIDFPARARSVSSHLYAILFHRPLPLSTRFGLTASPAREQAHAFSKTNRHLYTHTLARLQPAVLEADPSYTEQISPEQPSTLLNFSRRRCSRRLDIGRSSVDRPICALRSELKGESIFDVEAIRD